MYILFFVKNYGFILKVKIITESKGIVKITM